MWPISPVSLRFTSPLSCHIRHSLRSFTSVAPARTKELTLGGLGVGLAAVALAAPWKPEYHEQLSITDYKILHLKHQATGYETEEYKAARKVVHARCAERILDLCKKNGGIFIKAGQHITSLKPMIPAEYTDTLSVLQDRAPFRPLSKMEIVFKGEFDGRRPRELFAEFEEVPIAAASIAQVHRARTKSGEIVAVKVQYEDVSRLFSTDMWTFQTLSDLISSMFPEFEFSWIVSEFRDNVEKEFDFRNEARNGEETRRRFEHRAHELSVPGILWEYTTKRVLTMEYVHGVKVNDVEGIKAMGVDPRWVGRLLLEVFAEMIFCHGMFHGDPVRIVSNGCVILHVQYAHPKRYIPPASNQHAGNAFVAINPTTRRPQLVLIDHGLYRQLSTDFRLNYCHLWHSLLLNDAAGLETSAANLGVGRYATVLSFLFTGRSPDAAVPLSHELSHADRRRAAQHLRRRVGVTMNDIFVFLEHLPREMLVVFRVSHMVNALHRELGGHKVERFEVNARFATMGLWCETAEEMSSRDAWRTHAVLERTRPWRRSWWLYGGAPDFGRSIGFVKDLCVIWLRVWVLEVVLSIWQWWNEVEDVDVDATATVAKAVPHHGFLGHRAVVQQLPQLLGVQFGQPDSAPQPRGHLHIGVAFETAHMERIPGVTAYGLRIPLGHTVGEQFDHASGSAAQFRVLDYGNDELARVLGVPLLVVGDANEFGDGVELARQTPYERSVDGGNESVVFDLTHWEAVRVEGSREHERIEGGVGAEVFCAAGNHVRGVESLGEEGEWDVFGDVNVGFVVAFGVEMVDEELCGEGVGSRFEGEMDCVGVNSGGGLEEVEKVARGHGEDGLVHSAGLGRISLAGKGHG
ncbi:hypothetical protein BC938DRAFT_478112 [Jimgerdemannia flammicorona]|uniref:ABC1 atypical kinase-like domain-containing protein n=1 Tax=Jimgerdemannia flammicorona TaxID=994334 RepID=A0A433QND1_9FUNG|nr:hypothetical protein BC938DRAFT_478112 [Jimgerdemannia flammicorona]